MLVQRSSFGRGAVLACVLALLVGGCGRKGALEPPPGLPQAAAVPVGAPLAGARPARAPLVGSGQDLSEGGFQDAEGDPGLIQSPNTVYERSAIAKLNAATSVPPRRPINAPPVREPSTFFLDPLVK